MFQEAVGDCGQWNRYTFMLCYVININLFDFPILCNKAVLQMGNSFSIQMKNKLIFNESFHFQVE